MHRFVLTGGPCAGKTTILSRLIQELEERGYKVITVPEAATELILNGIHPSSAISMEEFQNFILDLQLMKEDLFSDAQHYYDSDKVVMFCDRGVLDSCAYIDLHPTFEDMLTKRGLTVANIHSRYDAILHLVTAADGAEKFYKWNDPSSEGVGNNAARSESPAEAREKDKKTLNSWIGHPHLRVFDNSTDFEGKIQRVVKEVFSILGELVPSEIERKFLIKKPAKFDLDRLGCMSATQIIQTYLVSDGYTERRVRQRGNREDGYSFYYTEKTDIGHGERSENERKISAKEYIEYLAEADTALHQIVKTRYCFVYDRKYFELDIYPFSDEYAILEIELNDINEEVNLPPLEIVAEVTDDTAYKNYNLAKTMELNPPPDTNAENANIVLVQSDVHFWKESERAAKEFDEAVDEYDMIFNVLETILKYYDHSTEKDYSIGELAEQKVCLVPTNAGWEVYVVERGQKFDVSEHDNLIDAGATLIEQLADDQARCDKMIEVFKQAVNDTKLRHATNAYEPITAGKQWIYETGQYEANVLGSGTNIYNVFKSFNPDKVFMRQMLDKGNYIRRYNKIDGRLENVQYWNKFTGKWMS